MDEKEDDEFGYEPGEDEECELAKPGFETINMNKMSKMFRRCNILMLGIYLGGLPY